MHACTDIVIHMSSVMCHSANKHIGFKFTQWAFSRSHLKEVNGICYELQRTFSVQFGKSVHISVEEIVLKKNLFTLV